MSGPWVRGTLAKWQVNTAQCNCQVLCRSRATQLDRPLCD
jgi:hypothetical protein